MSDLPTEHTHSSSILEAIRAQVARVNVSLPAVVESWDRAAQTAIVSVVPCGRRRVGKDDTECVVPDPVQVPVEFPGAGGYSITWDLAPGDTGRLVVCDRSISEWIATGASRTEPVDYLRRHSLQDGIFHPGLRSPANPLLDPAVLEAALVIRALTKVVIDCPDVRLGSEAATDPVALDTLVATELLRLVDYIINTWVPVAGDGGASLKAALTALKLGPPTWPASMGATKVTAE